MNAVTEVIDSILTKDEQAMLAFFVPTLIAMVILMIALKGDPDPGALVLMAVFAAIAVYFLPGFIAVL